MIRYSPFTSLLLLISVCSISRNAWAVDESVEPLLEYAVSIGDRVATVSEGESVQLEGTYNNPRIKVSPQSYRVFPYQGLSFKYPRSFAFEAEVDNPSAKNWTLSGNDLKIMYFVLNAKLTTGDFANSMIDQFGRENASIANANISISLGKEKLSGTSIKVTFATHVMSMDIYRIPSEESTTKLLVFQDNIEKSGDRSEEGKKTLDLIKSSFVID